MINRLMRPLGKVKARHNVLVSSSSLKNTYYNSDEGFLNVSVNINGLMIFSFRDEIDLEF